MELYPPKYMINVMTKCFGVGVSCRNLYSFVVYFYVSGSGSITSVGELCQTMIISKRTYSPGFLSVNQQDTASV